MLRKPKTLEDNRFVGLATHFRYHPGHDVALDVGAFNGVYAMNFAKFFDQVIAFEPNEQMVMRDAKKFGNIHFERCALSNYIGNSEFSVIKNRPAFSCLDFKSVEHAFRKNMEREGLDIKPDIQVHEIPVRTLDSFAYDVVDFIKIDSEGNGIKVLEGASDTIARHCPTMQIEMVIDEKDQIIEFMQDNGYVLVVSKTWIGIHNNPLNCYPAHHPTDGIFVHSKYNPRTTSC